MPKITTKTFIPRSNPAFDYYAIAAAVYIYQEYFKQNLAEIPTELPTLLSSDDFTDFDNAIAFYKNIDDAGRKEELYFFLKYFFENRYVIENWYKEKNISYQGLFESVFEHELRNSDTNISPEELQSSLKKLSEVLVIYDFLDASDQLYSDLQREQNFNRAYQLATQRTIDIISRKLLPLIAKCLKKNDISADEKEKLTKELILYFLRSALSSIFTYANKAVQDKNLQEEEQVSILIYMEHLQIFFITYLENAFKDPSLTINKIFEHLSQINTYENDKDYGKTLQCFKQFKKLYELLPETEVSSTKETMLLVVYNIYKKALLDKAVSNSDKILTEHINDAVRDYLFRQGKKWFGPMFARGESGTDEIALKSILWGYLYLSLYNNRVNGLYESPANRFLIQLINYSNGDVNNINYQATDGITAEELEEIYKQNPEVEIYLTAFQDAFDEVSEISRTEADGLHHQHINSIKRAIQDTSDKSSGCADTASCYSTSSGKTGASSESEGFIEPEPILIRDAESDAVNEKTRRGEYNYEKLEILAYCHYALAINTREINPNTEPRTAGNIAGLKFFILFLIGNLSVDVRKEAAEFIEIKLQKPNLIHSSKAIKNQFIQGFMDVFMSTRLLGLYKQSITKMQQSDLGLTALLLTQYLPPKHRYVMFRSIITSVDIHSEAMFIDYDSIIKTLFEEIRQQWQATLKSLQPTYGGFHTPPTAEFQRVKYQELKNECEEVKQILTYFLLGSDPTKQYAQKLEKMEASLNTKLALLGSVDISHRQPQIATCQS